MDSNSRPPQEREIYPNAPLRLVAAELRFPLSPRLATVEPSEVLAQLGELVPVVEEAQQVMQVTIGPSGSDLPAQAPFGPPRLLRLLSKRRDLAVTITGTNAIIETTRYERFEQFQAVVQDTLEALAALGSPVGVERLGLRYINEVRVDEVDAAPGDWHGLIDDDLLTPTVLVGEGLASKGLGLQRWQNVIQLAGSEGHGAQVMFGAGLGSVVNPNGPLRFLGAADDRPAFVFDMDSYWAPSDLPDFSVASLIEEFEVLHQSVRDLFERVITQRLREVFRSTREGANGD